jgi:hypothetical protein
MIGRSLEVAICFVFVFSVISFTTIFNQRAYPRVYDRVYGPDWYKPLNDPTYHLIQLSIWVPMLSGIVLLALLAFYLRQGSRK